MSHISHPFISPVCIVKSSALYRISPLTSPTDWLATSLATHPPTRTLRQAQTSSTCMYGSRSSNEYEWKSPKSRSRAINLMITATFPRPQTLADQSCHIKTVRSEANGSIRAGWKSRHELAGQATYELEGATYELFPSAITGKGRRKRSGIGCTMGIYLCKDISDCDSEMKPVMRMIDVLESWMGPIWMDGKM